MATLRSGSLRFCFQRKFSQIFQSAEIPHRKLSEILTEFLIGAGLLHQYIATEILIIFNSKFLQGGKYQKFSVEHTLFVKMCLYTRKVKTMTSFLDKSLKNNTSKVHCKTSKIKTNV